MAYQFSVKVQKNWLPINWFLEPAHGHQKQWPRSDHGHPQPHTTEKISRPHFQMRKRHLIEINQAEEIDFSSLMEE
jgi:hypothetical protein